MKLGEPIKFDLESVIVGSIHGKELDQNLIDVGILNDLHFRLRNGIRNAMEPIYFAFHLTNPDKFDDENR